MPASVSIIILTYNSQVHLPGLFKSLAAQTLMPHEVIVVDNASSDGTVAWLKQQQRLQIKLIENKRNVWFAEGNNRGIAASTGEYVFICNDDTELTPNFFEILVQRLERTPKAAMVGGKMLKLIDQKPSQIIDSAGLQQFKSGRSINRGEQEVDMGQFDEAEMVFGITGAGMLLRRSALEQVKYGADEYFDADFIAYKEDIDLSWRLQRAGYSVWYEPRAVMYHARSIQQTTLASRLQKPAIIRAYSYRNHWWMLIKNLSPKDWLKRLLWIVPYECAKLAYAFVREWSTLAIIPQTIAGIPRMLHKRYDQS